MTRSVSIRIPEGLLFQMDEFINSSKKYNSRADLIKHITRVYLSQGVGYEM